jgi:lysophospholipase L1-like esterase
LAARREHHLLLVLLLLGLLAGLATAKLALRLTKFKSSHYYVWPPGFVRVSHPLPGLFVGVAGEARFTVNSVGIRGDEFTNDQRFRILAVGGSTTECLYLDDAKAWPNLLQQALRGQSGRHVWVGNVGRSGLASRHHVVELDHLLPQYPRLDAVLVLAGVNDLLQRLRQGDDYDPSVLDRLAGEAELIPYTFSVYPLGAQNRHRVFVTRTALWQLVGGLRHRDDRKFQDEAGELYRRQRDARGRAAKILALPELAASLAEYARNLERLADTSLEHHARLVLATQPVLWRADLPAHLESLLAFGRLGNNDERYVAIPVLAAAMERYNEILRTVGRRRGVLVVDLAARLPQDSSVFYDDFHFNEGGARLLAGVFAEALAPLVGKARGSAEAPR